jgi:hypothetical protein
MTAKADLTEFRQTLSGDKLGRKLVDLGLIPARSFEVKIAADAEGAVSITASWWADDRLLEALGGEVDVV